MEFYIREIYAKVSHNFTFPLNSGNPFSCRGDPYVSLRPTPVYLGRYLLERRMFRTEFQRRTKPTLCLMQCFHVFCGFRDNSTEVARVYSRTSYWAAQPPPCGKQKQTKKILCLNWVEKRSFITRSSMLKYGGTRWRSWLRHCATNWKVASSIPDGVFAIFYWHNPSGRTMAMGLTQPLTEMNNGNIYWGVKAAGS
jgi:hypothetical protein